MSFWGATDALFWNHWGPPFFFPAPSSSIVTCNRFSFIGFRIIARLRLQFMFLRAISRLTCNSCRVLQNRVNDNDNFKFSVAYQCLQSTVITTRQEIKGVIFISGSFLSGEAGTLFFRGLVRPILLFRLYLSSHYTPIKAIIVPAESSFCKNDVYFFLPYPTGFKTITSSL